MLEAIYTLKNKYKEKKIYIWNINRDSVMLFTEVAFRRINVQGFATLQNEYVGETFMNRPILSLKQLVHEDDCIILVSNTAKIYTFPILPDEKMIYWSDAVEINEELRKRKIIIYGTGGGANQLDRVLADEGLIAGLYCVTKKNSAVQKYKRKNVIEATELEEYQDYAVIISVTTGQYRHEIMEILLNFSGRVFVEQIINEAVIEHINLFQCIDFAIKKNKKIYIYSNKNILSELLEDILAIYGVKISGYVGEMEDEEQGIVCIYDLALNGIEDKLIILNEECEEYMVAARECIEFAGFSLEEKNYTGLQWYARAKERILGLEPMFFDPLVGLNRIFEERKPGIEFYGKPGWKMHGKEDGDRVRIMILGGSTSAEVYHPENWVRKLYYKLARENIMTVIYNGAYEGNDIVDEMLRLLRDIYVLHPQIVISMSGVNNTEHKESVSLFNADYLVEIIQDLASDGKYCSGVYSDESFYSFWSRNMKLMKTISEFHGAVFLGFLQPINYTMNNVSLWEKSVYEMEEHREGVRDFNQSANDRDGYINLMRLFEHQDEMYFDMCHYTDKGHEIIADKVFEEVMHVLKELK